MTSPLQNLAEFFVSTTQRKLHQKSTPTKQFFQQHFLLHDLDLQVNFASQESDCEFNYGFSLIQKTFAKLL